MPNRRSDDETFRLFGRATKTGRDASLCLAEYARDRLGPVHYGRRAVSLENTLVGPDEYDHGDGHHVHEALK